MISISIPTYKAFSQYGLLSSNTNHKVGGTGLGQGSGHRAWEFRKRVKEAPVDAQRDTV
jgi:hypothetical protein